MAGRRAWTAVLAVLAVLGAVPACSAGPGERTRLTVATFGEFGYEALFDEYESLHPDIEIVGRVADFESHHRGLVTQLAGGGGAADIVAIEEQYVPRLRQSKDKLVDLGRFGAHELRGQWAPWKWDQGVTDGGRFVLGLGTDMGGLALCYRRDLFERAGLPTDRAQVAALMPTWEAYLDVAGRFAAAGTGAKFADSAGTVYAAILNQAPENYFAADGDRFIADTNPNVRRAFDIAGTLGERGQTARVTTFTQTWNAAIKQGSFATIACPAWQLKLIREAAGPADAGKWDVTTVPGGAGNQGGSFLSLPAQGEHQQQAYDLARWLTAPEQQKKLFLSEGILSSQPAVYRDPDVLGKTDPYFSGAPTGQLFASSADRLRPVYRGTADAEVRPEFGRALGRIEDGKQTIAQAWEEAVRLAREAAG
ncbi:extracellular solute-binding protein [Amycolatopsis suaedae]|uniref:Extracellular solute-binding protein n=1 Tax=Amycolatopsis suaedae TaxID=2510978 RepID=A0A4Q7J2L3_9PSEU|nr:extracellular solute-binding protein [Amycolatopsis suaedae]RZQ60194.1 extracellular solute-binding protein [Amycolatopsis suaedae]